MPNAEEFSFVLVNGETTDQLSVQDRGLLYGDGLFETIAYRNGKCELISQHRRRLRSGCDRLHIFFEEQQLDGDIEQCVQYLKHQAVSAAVIKVIVTRGVGHRGYGTSACGAASRIIIASGFPDVPAVLYKKGVSIRRCTTTVSSSVILAGLKHLNRLENVMARAEWDDADIFEGLMQDNNGLIIEGTMSNLFFVDGKQQLHTPRLTSAGVAGVMRKHIIDHLAPVEGLSIKETQVHWSMLEDAEEVFLTNSIIGVVPVIECGATKWMKGPVTEQLLQAWGRSHHV